MRAGKKTEIPACAGMTLVQVGKALSYKRGVIPAKAGISVSWATGIFCSALGLGVIPANAGIHLPA